MAFPAEVASKALGPCPAPHWHVSLGLQNTYAILAIGSSASGLLPGRLAGLLNWSPDIPRWPASDKEIPEHRTDGHSILIFQG